ncbi:hypothetical protein BG011_001055 [Mortierella polycephala]|uniref:Transcription initiation factor IIF subunit alpha n=1 Tax=Mortierella polycephala TaxID=41804 RepID=A0A9P6PLQ9_9FUNG|nr:hypothetical protein BG011_001055 [Mortierella polycephala]
MSFLRSRPPVQSNRQQQQQRALAARTANNGPAIKRQIEKPEPQPIPGTYTDYKLVSTSRDVLHHIMRFHSTKEVNPATFAAPVKLHRKRNENSHYYRGYYNKYNNQNNANNNNSNAAGSSTRDFSGDVKKEGVGAGGGAFASAAGNAPPTTGADTTLIAPYGGGVRNKQMLFKKRTRQIYIANEEERKKKEIEAAPWVVEDYDSQNNWTGQLEGGQGANYVLFVFSDDGFKVVPADKWYKFSPKIQYTTLTAEEAEEQYQKSQKQSNSIRWLMRSKNKAKTEDGEEGAEEDVEREQLVTVDHEDDIGYDEDEAKERKRMRGKHGDVDEMDFDEVWQDDEEMPSEMPGFEEDDKDDPRRKHGQSMDSDEDEDEEDTKGRLNEAGKAMKKALRKLEKNKVYESDDDRDPYASDQGSSDSDLDEIDKEKDVKKEDELTGLSQDGSKTKGKAKANAKGAPLINKKSSAAKPTSTKPVGAKAMKTKAPLPIPRNASAGAQANGKSSLSTAKAGSSTSQRAHSPTLVSGGVSSGSEKKRKLIDSRGGEGGGDIPNKKYARANIAQSSSSTSTSQASSSASASQAPNNDSWLITEAEIVSYLKSRKEVTTRDLILSLKDKLLRDPRNKNLMATLTKKVAVPTNGILVLKPGY